MLLAPKPCEPIEASKRPAPPWRKPWGNQANAGFPVNVGGCLHPPERLLAGVDGFPGNGSPSPRPSRILEAVTAILLGKTRAMIMPPHADPPRPGETPGAARPDPYGGGIHLKPGEQPLWPVFPVCSSNGPAFFWSALLLIGVGKKESNHAGNYPSRRRFNRIHPWCPPRGKIPLRITRPARRRRDYPAAKEKARWASCRTNARATTPLAPSGQGNHQLHRHEARAHPKGKLSMGSPETTWMLTPTRSPSTRWRSRRTSTWASTK